MLSGIASGRRLGGLRRRHGERDLRARPRRRAFGSRERLAADRDMAVLDQRLQAAARKAFGVAGQEGVEPLAGRLGLDPEGPLLYQIGHDRLRRREDEAPLDPAAARLRRKLVRLLFVSGGIMMLGLIAVFAAIVYKLNEGGDGGARRASRPPRRSRAGRHPARRPDRLDRARRRPRAPDACWRRRVDLAASRRPHERRGSRPLSGQAGVKGARLR